MDRIIYQIKRFYYRSKVSFYLLAIMLTYFIFLSLMGGSTNSEVLLRYGAFYPPFVVFYREVYRFITSIFIHIGLSHLFFNGYALYVFGPQLERLMGPKKFLSFFLLTGVFGNLLTLFFNFNSLSAGASGSLFGLFGGFLYLLRRHKNMVTPQGRRDIISLILINLTLTLLVPSISVTAHLGGFISGYFLSYFFIK